MFQYFAIPIINSLMLNFWGGGGKKAYINCKGNNVFAVGRGDKDSLKIKYI